METEMETVTKMGTKKEMKKETAMVTKVEKETVKHPRILLCGK